MALLVLGEEKEEITIACQELLHSSGGEFAILAMANCFSKLKRKKA